MIRQNLIEQRKGISPIIATLLLILIAIAAGVIVYAYVIGFIGNSTTNSGGAQSVVSIDNFCTSAAGASCGATSTWVSLTLRNVGSNAFPSGTINVYLTDVTSGTTATYTCVSTSPSPGTTQTCNDGVSTGFSKGDTVTLKVVMPDGGSSTASTKTIS